LDAFGAVAGPLLAKDLAIFAGVAADAEARDAASTLLAAADAALARMGIARPVPGR
jgi:hypothetical protein